MSAPVPHCLKDRIATLRVAIQQSHQGGIRGGAPRDVVGILAHDVDVTTRQLRERWGPKPPLAVRDFLLNWESIKEDMKIFRRKGHLVERNRLVRALRYLYDQADDVQTKKDPFVVRIREYLLKVFTPRKYNMTQLTGNVTEREETTDAIITLCVTILLSITALFYWLYGSQLDYGPTLYIEAAKIGILFSLLSCITADLVKVLHLMVAGAFLVVMSFVISILTDGAAMRTRGDCVVVLTMFYCQSITMLNGISQTGSQRLAAASFLCALLAALAGGVVLAEGRNTDDELAWPLTCLLAITLYLQNNQSLHQTFHLRMSELSLTRTALNEYRVTCMQWALEGQAHPSAGARKSLADEQHKVEVPGSVPVAADDRAARARIHLPHDVSRDDSFSSIEVGEEEEVISNLGSLEPTTQWDRASFTAQRPGQPPINYSCRLSAFQGVLTTFGAFSDGRIGYWPETIETILGIPSKAALGRNMLELLEARCAIDDHDAILHLTAMLNGRVAPDAMVRIKLKGKEKGRSSPVVSIGCVECVEGKIHLENNREIVAQSFFIFYLGVSANEARKAQMEVILRKVTELKSALGRVEQNERDAGDGRVSPRKLENIRQTVQQLYDVAHTQNITRVNLQALLSSVISEHAEIARTYRVMLRVSHRDVTVDGDNLSLYFGNLLNAIIQNSPAESLTPRASSHPLATLNISALVDVAHGVLRIHIDGVRASNREYALKVTVLPDADDKNETSSLSTSTPMAVIGSALSQKTHLKRRLNTVVLGSQQFTRFISECAGARGHVVFAVGTIPEMQAILATIDIAVVQEKHIFMPGRSLSRVNSKSSMSSSHGNIVHLSQNPPGTDPNTQATSALHALRQSLRRKCVIIGVDPESSNEHMNWECNTFTVLHYPCTVDVVTRVMDETEKLLEEFRDAAERLSSLRQVFSKANHGQYTTGELLGSGASASVYKVTSNLTGGIMAMKVIPTKPLNPSALVTVLQEIDTFIAFSHPNVIQYLYVERAKEELHIFMEFACDGTLHKILHERRTGLTLPEFVQYADDITCGLEFLHGRGVVHRDLKTENILLSHGSAKVADFGCSELRSSISHANKFSQGTQQAVGTPLFMAPEVARGECENYTASDVWSLGCVFWEMLTGQRPFSHIAQGGFNVLKYVAQCAERGEDPDISPIHRLGFPIVAQMMQCCLRINPSQRLTVANLRSMISSVEMSMMGVEVGLVDCLNSSTESIKSPTPSLSIYSSLPPIKYE